MGVFPLQTIAFTQAFPEKVCGNNCEVLQIIITQNGCYETNYEFLLYICSINLLQKK